MDWVESESFWFFCPYFADVFVGGEALQGFEAFCVVIGIDEVREVLLQLVVAVIVIAFDGRLLDGPVHPLHLSVGPEVLDFGQPVFDTVFRDYPKFYVWGHIDSEGRSII